MKPESQYLTDHTGKKTAVVVPIEEYDALMDDLQDLAIIAERRDEPRDSLEEVKAKLIKDGFIQD